MIPRIGRPPERSRQYRLRPGAYAILARGTRLLVTHQTAPRAEFQLPGGGIDPGESPLRALHREVREETGWTLAAPRRLGAFRRFAYMPDYDLWAEKLCVIYLARPVQRLGPPSEDGHSAHWMDAAEAAERLGNAGDRGFVARYAASLAGSSPASG